MKATGVAAFEASTRMTSQERLDAALKRLAAALDRLESSAHGRPDIEPNLLQKSLVDELSALQDDHARLRGELDYAHEQIRSLEQTHVEALDRVKCAHSTIESILAESAVRKP